MTSVLRLGQGVVQHVVAATDRVVRALTALVIRRVLDQVDLTALVRERVDLNAVAEGIDVDAVAARLDVDRVVAGVDIDAIIGRVDIDAIAARVDLDAIIARLDLIGLANYVVDGIDLPGIVRESSGSMASEALSGVRLQSLQADEALSRAVGRFLPRARGARRSEPPVAGDGGQS
jgi:hypothetical protein